MSPKSKFKSVVQSSGLFVPSSGGLTRAVPSVLSGKLSAYVMGPQELALRADSELVPRLVFPVFTKFIADGYPPDPDCGDTLVRNPPPSPTGNMPPRTGVRVFPYLPL